MEIIKSRTPVYVVIVCGVGLVALLGFLLIRGDGRQEQEQWAISNESAPTAMVIGQPTATVWGLLQRRAPGAPVLTPTPDNPHPLPALRKEPEQYTVKAGDTLGQIAGRYGISLGQITLANQLINPNLLSIGQVLVIPAPIPSGSGSAFKVIPDSELVYGPADIGFDVQAEVQRFGGYLASYREEVGGMSLTGAQVVESIAQDFSVNPRLLLAVLEHQGGWLTNPMPEKGAQEYPIGFPDPARKGLYRQLAWAANNLSRGFYLWRVNAVPAWPLADGDMVPAVPTINAGTAGVQQFFALLDNRSGWEKDVSEQGLFATYSKLFGYPFDFAIDPSIPQNLTQPAMQLPFEAGAEWAFTGGPHAAWGDGSAWSSLDFAPPVEELGCVDSNAWVVAVADGLVLRSGSGLVVFDLDADGLEQTGWVVIFMHIATRDRIQAGVYLQAGERIGHPSCEGGVSTGTHFHIARRFNGEWIAADQSVPFNLDGWISSGAGKEYDGFLTRGSQRIEAYAGLIPENTIRR